MRGARKEENLKEVKRVMVQTVKKSKEGYDSEKVIFEFWKIVLKGHHSLWS